MESKSTPKILIGHRYGHWVITSLPQRIGGDTRYMCQCVCGTEKLVSAITLRNGSSTSCGCMRHERTTKVSHFELRPTPPEIQAVFQLISDGYLPPADQFSMIDGSPSWTLSTLAKILGIGDTELIDHLKQGRARFAQSRPLPQSLMFMASV